jgi:hypothetical protein
VFEMTVRLLSRIAIGAAIWWAAYFLVRCLPIESKTRNRVLRILALILIVLIAGPEAGLGAEAFATLDALGAELFLASLILGLRMLPMWFIFERLKSILERVDPYFFVPSARQVRDCPPIACHALPCFVPICLAVALWGVAQVDA